MKVPGDGILVLTRVPLEVDESCITGETALMTRCSYQKYLENSKESENQSPFLISGT